MIPEEKDIALIEKYLRKELSADDRKMVQERLQSDASLKEKMKWHEDLLDVVREDRNKEMKLVLNKVEEESKELELKNIILDASSKIVQLNWIRWEAAILIIGIVMW